MKALRVPTITLLLSLFIAGIQSQAAPKLKVSVYQNNFPSALTQLKTTLAEEMEEINEIKESVGRSSSKAENLLSTCVKVISYLEELIEGKPASTLKCLIPGAKPDPIRGVCYLLVTNPILLWADAEKYCNDLKGGLLAPLPLDVTLGDTLASLFPELTTLTLPLWVDGVANVNNIFVYENTFNTGISSTGGHLTMTLPLTAPPGTPPTIVQDAVPTHKNPFICQLDAVTVLPPFKMAYVKYEDDTYIPDRKYLVDVESVNDVYHHSGENSDGYGHPNEEYHEEGYPEGKGNPENSGEELARQLNPKINL